MNKSELIDAIAARTELSKVASGKALDAVIESIIQAVAKGDGVSLVGFGSFKSAARAAREGKNPKTGEKIKIAATTLIFAAVAFGAWRLTQRKPWGLIAVSLPATLGNPSFATLYLFFIALIFGAPLMLALIESRYHRSET